MRISRIYINNGLKEGVETGLTGETAHYAINVLRMQNGQQLVVFNGKGGQYSAEIINIKKGKVEIKVREYQPDERESSLDITLVQGISRSQRMDYAIQKSVELGVARIVPVITEFCSMQLNTKHNEKKYNHWRKIIINACEQCGRNRLPVLDNVIEFANWLNLDTNRLKIILHPDKGTRIADINSRVDNITILTGPEGGFSQNEFEQALKSGYQPVKLGPRILRTETASIAAISACQAMWGDL